MIFFFDEDDFDDFDDFFFVLICLFDFAFCIFVFVFALESTVGV